MIRSGRDDDLRRAFRDLRNADRRDAPGFGTVLGRPAPGRSVRPARWRRPAFAAAALLIAAAALVTVLRDGPSGHEALATQLLRQAEELGSWEAPTDTFYEMPELERLYQEPSLGLTSIELPELTDDDGRSDT